MSGNASADLAPLLRDVGLAARLRLLQVDSQAAPPAWPATPAVVFSRLTTLVLRNVHLMTEDLPPVLASFAPTLVVLTLDGNLLTSVPEGLLSNDAGPMPPLQTLSLRGNQLTSLRAGVVDSVAETLVTFNLRENALTSLPVGLLGAAFPNLRVLYVIGGFCSLRDSFGLTIWFTAICAAMS